MHTEGVTDLAMDINEAATAIQTFFESYAAENDDWSPEEIRALPSGDDRAGIKVFFNFGEGTENVEQLRERAAAALRAAHAGIASTYRIEYRADAM